MLGLILKSLLWYRRTHAAVLLAVAISAAVIGGSLIVGDSVRASLRQMTLSRLGHMTHVVNSPRFVREQLAAEMQAGVEASADGLRIAPALLLPGSVEKPGADGTRLRAAGVLLTGLKPADWDLFNVGELSPPGDSGIVLGYRTAQELGAQPGDRVSVWVELPSSIPRDSLMGDRENLTIEIELTVEGVLPETAGASRFSLQPSQQLPLNAFLSLSVFQQRLNLEERQATRRNPTAKPARVNTLLIGRRSVDAAMSESTPVSDLMRQDAEDVTVLRRALEKSLTPEDIGLRIRPIENRGYLSVESDSMILEDAVSESVLQAAEAIGMRAFPTLVYLANELYATARSGTDERYSMYSILAGLDFSQPPPLGPMELSDGRPVPALTESEIVISPWLAEDLQVREGDTIEARWHEVGSHGDLPETKRTFTVRGILKADDPRALDRDLTPLVEGVTDVDSFSDWDQPFEMEMDRITPRDDAWWEEYRATPKAFVGLGVAEQFWSSRFGRYTSIRVASEGVALAADRLEILRDRLVQEIRARVSPARLGLFVRPIRVEGLMAATGASNFTLLFMGFSFFLILSGLLLAALMFQLGVRQRVQQIGLLEALGFSAARARGVLTLEGLIVAALGSVMGCWLAVGFAKLMIYGLTTWWVGAIGTRFLLLEIRLQSLAIAAGVSLMLAAGVIWNAVRRMTKRSPRELLSGQSSEELELRRGRLAELFWTVSLLSAVVLAPGLPLAVMAGVLPATEAFGGMSWQVVSFFVSGFCWLAVGLIGLRRALRRRNSEMVTGAGLQSLTGLSLANAARNPQRSLLTASLIAFAAFVIVAVGAGRRNPVSETPERRSGNGGFSLVGESSLPILFDMNTAEGRLRLGLGATKATELPEGTTIFGFRTRPGEDASCLNLYQAKLPTLLGATPEFLARGGFRFADTPGENPWSLLADKKGESKVQAGDRELPVVPVIGDLNTLQFSLKKKLGDVILFPDAESPTHALRVVGMLDSSIFQGVLVMSEEHLKTLAPESSGARYFLVETTSAEAMQTASVVLETALQSFGMDTEQVSRRLADFLAVQNTYLSTFQMLGGLGLLVGTFGLAAVMMRNVLERRSEIALLRALGFRAGKILWLIVAENTLLLLWGLLSGTVAALVAMLPHLKSTGADVPWLELTGTLIVVAATGTLAVAAPVRMALGISVREVLTTE